MTVPAAKRVAGMPAPSIEPEKLRRLAEDPVSEKVDMGAEQAAAFQPPEHGDERVRRDESDQGRTR